MHVKEGVGFAVLVDSTTECAFGPLFAGEWEVEGFLDWATTPEPETGKAWLEERYGRDLRMRTTSEIAGALVDYQAEVEQGTWDPKEEA